ncbi:hypothetical protein [Qipengyuania aquimaris]|uniref:Uncharacterized protein n=1 Tax=Qipengyuania aquimaris TaxID=255984 RepID=A0A9Q3S018_9SPHN|nr:hypothetical protein [Qipengyuania aquimaris]MBY6217350.1 hypothetical protein [Qipengyuania aquimaris]
MKKTCVLPALSILWLAPLSAQEAAPPPPPPDYDEVVFEAKLRGQPIAAWSLFVDGSGVWSEFEQEEGAPAYQYTRIYREIERGVTNYVGLERILRQLPKDVPDYDRCEQRVTDAAYGTIRMTSGARTIELAWNSGCFDEDYRAFMQTLTEADRYVAALGEDGRAMRTEKVE